MCTGPTAAPSNVNCIDHWPYHVGIQERQGAHQAWDCQISRRLVDRGICTGQHVLLMPADVTPGNNLQDLTVRSATASCSCATQF